MKIRLFSLLILLAVLLAACSGPASPVVSTLPATDEQQAAPQAVQTAQQALANQLGVSLLAVNLDKIEDAQWPDACLGLPQPDEACAEVITPGYLITFSANGLPYQVRTNRDGQIVRLMNATAVPQTDQQPLAVEKVREALATRLGIAIDQVKVTGFEPVDWTDGCLGLGQPNESCLMAIVPGYRVRLEANGTAYVFRTDLGGDQVREESGQIEELGVVLTWSRSGGIAGFCDQLMMFASGRALSSSCKNTDTRSGVQLSAEQMATLTDWTQRFSSFTYEQTDPASADAMTLSLVFTGSGQQSASDADKAAMLEFAQAVFTAAPQ